MGLLVRKINKSKWPKNDETNVFAINAEVFYACINPKGNALSVWEISDETMIEEAVLALASGFQHLETIDVVLLKDDELSNKVKRLHTVGNTKVKDLEHTHIDLGELNYFTIGLVAEHILKSIKDKRVKRYNIGDLRRILNNAISAGRLNKDDLATCVAQKL